MKTFHFGRCGFVAHVELRISLSWRQDSRRGSDLRRRNDDERKAEERNGSPIVFFSLTPFGWLPQVVVFGALSIFFSSRRAAAAAAQSTMESEQPSFQWRTQLQRSAATTGHSAAISASQTRRARVKFTPVAISGQSFAGSCVCAAAARTAAEGRGWRVQ